MAYRCKPWPATKLGQIHCGLGRGHCERAGNGAESVCIALSGVLPVQQEPWLDRDCFLTGGAASLVGRPSGNSQGHGRAPNHVRAMASAEIGLGAIAHGERHDECFTRKQMQLHTLRGKIKSRMGDCTWYCIVLYSILFYSNKSSPIRYSQAAPVQVVIASHVLDMSTL
jgi:hypothetical protein